MIELKGAITFSDEPCFLGIDEAGRGPVLGHMVYACCYWPESYQVNNPKKVNSYVDSKKTTEAEREKLYDRINTARLNGELDFKYYPLDPKDLSNDQLGNVRNLNVISHDTAIALIKATIEEGTKLKHVFIDTVGPPDKYKVKLEKVFDGTGIEFTVWSKADSLYKCVSAASIVAKYHRDRLLKDWTFVETKFNDRTHTDFGCGYPGDPVTKVWLQQHQDPVFGFPLAVRFSWSTCDRIINESEMAKDQDKVSCYFPCHSNYEKATKNYIKEDDGKSTNKATGLARKIGLEPF